MPTKVWLLEKEQEKIKGFHSTASDFLLKIKATPSSQESQVAAFSFCTGADLIDSTSFCTVPMNRQNNSAEVN